MYILSAKYSDDVKGFSRHFHDAHELLYVVAGRISVNVGGEEREAGAGSLLVFSRFEEHSVRVLTPEYRRFTLLISELRILKSHNTSSLESGRLYSTFHLIESSILLHMAVLCFFPIVMWCVNVLQFIERYTVNGHLGYFLFGLLRIKMI